MVLAQRGWDVTGIDIIPKAVRGARTRAQRAGVEATFVEGTVTDVAGAGVGGGFRLVLDFGTLHGLTPAEFTEAARGVTAASTEGASLLMLAPSPGGRGPVPRGVDRDEVARAFAGWEVLDNRPFEAEGIPKLFAKTRPRWYRLRRV